MFGQRGDRFRERLTAVNRGDEAAQHLLAFSRGVFLRERLQRLDEVQPRLEERKQLDGKERCLEGRTAAHARHAERLPFPLDGEHGEAAAFRHAARVGLAPRLAA